MTSVGLEGLKNNLNNYKGVMLCTRPNENISVPKDKPFVSRVDPKENLGINPVKKNKPHVAAKKHNPILMRHRLWLEEFKNKIREKKAGEGMKDRQDRERFERIREQAVIQRELNHSDEEAQKQVSKESPQQEQVPVPKKQAEEKPHKSASKKKDNAEKPKWAYTEQQLQDEEEEEADDLLEFTKNLDYDKYINDLEVKNMIAALKHKIDDLRSKEEDDWKKKIVDSWNDARKSMNTSKVDIGFDAKSDGRSVASDSRSVASERSHQSIAELKNKQAKEKKDWDVVSTSTKKNAAVSLEERIAKHVADEVLRNNTEFRHFHSNASVRRILEKEAQKHLEDVKGIRAPEIVNNKEYFLRKDIQDPNNLPYLHRNPAI